MRKISDSFGGDMKQIYCIAHRLHLMVCNGLGLWIRKKQEQSTSNTNTTTSNTNSTTSIKNNDEADSDDDDFSDDIQVFSQLTTANHSSNINSLSDQLYMSNESLNTNIEIETDTAMDETCIDEEPIDLFDNVIDNWSVDVVENVDPSTYDSLQEDIAVLMKKCRSFVKLINKSSILMNYIINLKAQFKISRSLQLDCKCRWNSSYHLIESILIYKKIINKVNSEKHNIGLNTKQTTKLYLIELDQYEWKLLELLELVLKPVIEATKLVSGRQYPTIGISYFAIIQIRDFLEDSIDVNVKDWKLLTDLKNMLLKQVQKYFIENDQQWNLMKNYSYFDPIGYGCLTRRERRAIEQYIIELHEERIFEETNDQHEVNQIQLNTNMKQKSEQPKSSSIAKFLNSVGKMNTSSQLVVTTANKKRLVEEMTVYRSLAQQEYNSIISNEKDPDVIRFWQLHRVELNYLYKYASYHLVSPASSVASESAFSTASYLLRKQRSRLTPENLCYSMFLKDKLQDESNI